MRHFLEQASPAHLSDAIEPAQKQALPIIYPKAESYAHAMLLNEPEYNRKRNPQKYYIFKNIRACRTKRAENFFTFRYFN